MYVNYSIDLRLLLRHPIYVSEMYTVTLWCCWSNIFSFSTVNPVCVCPQEFTVLPPPFIPGTGFIETNKINCVILLSKWWHRILSQYLWIPCLLYLRIASNNILIGKFSNPHLLKTKKNCPYNGAKQRNNVKTEIPLQYVEYAYFQTDRHKK